MGEIRDPIYGFITPSDRELKIINSPLFQRLRKIKQLALTNLVYPSANNSRFDHSLGAFHVASLMAKKLLPEEPDACKRDIIRFAALLHDIGHGPFSHSSEPLLKKYALGTTPSNSEIIHEEITAHLINTDKDIKNIISADERNQIVNLLQGKRVDLTLMREIVSGPLDADKLDYLLRDSYFCGVKYGVYDIHRLINTLEKYSDKSDEHICIQYDGINALEQYVLAKYYLTTQVYFHKVRRVSDAMITRGIELGIEKDNIKAIKKLFSYESSVEYFNNYLNWWDDRLFALILYSKPRGYAYKVFKDLFDRTLFKIIYSDEIKKIPIAIRDKIHDINSLENRRFKLNLERQIADIINIKPAFVIAHCVSIKSPKDMSRDSEGEISIRKDSGKVVLFNVASDVFKSINKSLKRILFEVYAPVVYTDVLDKQKKKEFYRKEISKILQQYP